jgi:hypothetical protein
MKAEDVDYRHLNEESAVELANGKEVEKKEGEPDTIYQ